MEERYLCNFSLSIHLEARLIFVDFHRLLWRSCRDKQLGCVTGHVSKGEVPVYTVWSQPLQSKSKWQYHAAGTGSELKAFDTVDHHIYGDGLSYWAGVLGYVYRVLPYSYLNVILCLPTVFFRDQFWVPCNFWLFYLYATYSEHFHTCLISLLCE